MGVAPSRELFDLCDERKEMGSDFMRRISRPPRPGQGTA